MRLTGRHGHRAYAIVVTAFVVCLPLVAACGALGGSSACDGLVYKESGLPRAEYLPCAAEMIAALDQLDAHVDKMLAGDEAARSDAQATLGELGTLLRKAGGRNMLERWDDRALTSLNLDIWNAYNHHQACMMVSRQLFGRAPLGDEKYRDAARSECSAYQSSYRDASSAYRSLR